MTDEERKQKKRERQNKYICPICNKRMRKYEYVES